MSLRWHSLRMVVWKRLIRFEANDGVLHCGEPLVEETDDVSRLADAGKLTALVVIGEDVFADSARLGKEEKTVKKLYGPLTGAQVPIIRCVGLNYMKHIKEAGRKPPPYPSIFFKPSDCVADYGAEIAIPTLAQDEQCDYEGELVSPLQPALRQCHAHETGQVIVVRRDGKDIREEEALQYVAGYVAGNDISARKWQRDPEYAGGVPQWGFSKGFDQYAPLGPCIVSPSILGDASCLTLQTFVNGELRQDTNTNDMIFGVKKLVAFLSQGTTLRKGSLIMTGTPSGELSTFSGQLAESPVLSLLIHCADNDAGVAMGMKEPKWLKHGDEVEVYIEKIGTLRNRIAFL